MFLERVYEGKNDIGRWLAMIVVLVIVTVLVGSIPLSMMIFINLSGNPDLEPNPDNPYDLSAYDISSITGFVLMIIPFVVGLIALLLLVKPIHERSWLSVFTGHSSFRFKRFFWGAGVWLLFLSLYSVIASLTGIQKNEFQFQPGVFFELMVATLLLIPIQAGFEETFFRGYLMQGFGLLFKYKWIALLLTAILFGSLHYFNPEVKAFGSWLTMPQYLWFGLFFGICTLMDDGLELAWGVHAINNIFLTLIFTQESTALETPALFYIKDFNPLVDLLMLFVLSVIFLFWASRNFQWGPWRELLYKIAAPEVVEDEGEFHVDEYDEYENEEE